jgi:hypothetical protein
MTLATSSDSLVMPRVTLPRTHPLNCMQPTLFKWEIPDEKWEMPAQLPPLPPLPPAGLCYGSLGGNRGACTRDGEQASVRDPSEESTRALDRAYADDFRRFGYRASSPPLAPRRVHLTHERLGTSPLQTKPTVRCSCRARRQHTCPTGTTTTQTRGRRSWASRVAHKTRGVKVDVRATCTFRE